MKLSIITINRNNATGLEKTLQSVANQTYKEFEYIVVDGASTDNSVEVIQQYAPKFKHLKWVSEPDFGIYNAMNKGIKMASGDYIQILNSADCLASETVVDQMFKALDDNDNPTILYGNMIKCFADGRRVVDRCFAGQPITMLGMYTGTLNHDPAYIRRDLFEKYGHYDETLKIVSDWKWYLHAIILGGEKPCYTDLNVTLFDMTGISEDAGSKSVIRQEREQVLSTLIPNVYLSDYQKYASDIHLMRRIHRHPWAYKIVRFIERCLFKLEKMRNKNEQAWH